MIWEELQMKFRIVPYYGKYRPQVFDEENNEYKDICSTIGCSLEEARDLCREYQGGENHD